MPDLQMPDLPMHEHSICGMTYKQQPLPRKTVVSLFVALFLSVYCEHYITLHNYIYFSHMNNWLNMLELICFHSHPADKMMQIPQQSNFPLTSVRVRYFLRSNFLPQIPVKLKMSSDWFSYNGPLSLCCWIIQNNPQLDHLEYALTL